MKTGLTRILSLFLVLAMLLSLAACKPKKETNSSSAPTTSSEPKTPIVDTDSEPDSSDLGDIGDEFGDDYYEEYPGEAEELGWQIQIDRPNTDGALSTGVKLSPEDDIPPLDFPEDDEPPFEDIGDIEEVPEVNYAPVIQKYGETVAGPVREITVDNSAVLFTDFSGFGCNVFPTQANFVSQVRSDDVPAYSELTSKRFNDSAPSYTRSWFTIDWIITNEAGDYKQYADNIDANPDYKNYNKGVYDFNSDEFVAAKEYWRMLEEVDAEIYLAYGWKIATRIQDWFGADPSRPAIGAPHDLKQYAKACVALFKHMREDEGFTNFNILSFYNEPSRDENYETHGWSWDYAVIGNKGVWYAQMVKECYDLFKADKKLKDVKFIVADASDEPQYQFNNEDYVTPYLKKHADEYVDAYSFHTYPQVYKDGDPTADAYSIIIDACTNFREYYEKPIWITEYYGNGKDTTDIADYKWNENGGWLASHTGLYLAAANTGTVCLLSWGFVGGYLPDPELKDIANGNYGLWRRPKNLATAGEIWNAYYEVSMLNSYVPKQANVLDIKWTGDDIRAGAFTSKDGKDFALVVEANEDSVPRDFQVKLKKSLGGKKIYAYGIEWDEMGAKLGGQNIQATIPTCDEVIDNVTDSFSYVGKNTGDYGVYVFSTIAPLKQIELYSNSGRTSQGVVVNVARNGSTTVYPKFVDEGEAYMDYPAMNADNLVWEIKQYSNAVETDGAGEELKRIRREQTGSDMGVLTENGDGSMTYEPPADAKSGDVIAIRCTIKDTNRYAVTMITVS